MIPDAGSVVVVATVPVAAGSTIGGKVTLVVVEPDTAEDTPEAETKRYFYEYYYRFMIIC